MSFDLSNHFPYGPEEGFEEAGHTLKAWQPANDEAKRVFVLQAFKGDDLVKEIEVPMSHTNIFGVDVEDLMELEQATDDLIVELGGESMFK